jgi:hypothetical protein
VLVNIQALWDLTSLWLVKSSTFRGMLRHGVISHSTWIFTVKRFVDFTFLYGIWVKKIRPF